MNDTPQDNINPVISSISEVPCPPSCVNVALKGCLTESAHRYGCEHCEFWIRDSISDYQLTPQDVYDMIHGKRIGPVMDKEGKPTLDDTGKPLQVRWTDFHKDAFTSKSSGKKFTAALAFLPNWKVVFRFPERAPVEETGRLCPECQKNGRNGRLIVRSGKSGKFIACSAWPKCNYREDYAPFQNKTTEAAS